MVRSALQSGGGDSSPDICQFAHWLYGSTVQGVQKVHENMFAVIVQYMIATTQLNDPVKHMGVLSAWQYTARGSGWHRELLHREQ